MSSEAARRNMLSQQIHTVGVVDPKIMHTLATTPRERFVPASLAHLAFADMALPVAPGVSLLPPAVTARIFQALALKPTDKVLQVGSGYGYLSALMAQHCKHVFSVDCEAALSERASDNCAACNIKNVTFLTGDASEGWPKQAPYDVIVVNGALPSLPNGLKCEINVQGKIFAILGDAPVMKATLSTRTTEGWTQQVLFETEAAPLTNAPKSDPFHL